MLTETTVNKLNEMKLTTMARAFKEQLITPNISELSFEDRFGLLVDQEWTSRKNNHLKKLINRAKFAEYDANVEDIEYHADRKLDAAQIARLATCNTSTSTTTFCCSAQPGVVQHILPALSVWQLYGISFR